MNLLIHHRASGRMAKSCNLFMQYSLNIYDKLGSLTDATIAEGNFSRLLLGRLQNPGAPSRFS